ncbi:SKY-like protein [Mya arenaria]|uniref:SKY-like protein n=1 Tax=Mya arenaria TaxID=6604 RepID=A0ABY7G2Z1_MYAAR|nr:SKY-like protein [Mya arenaria]
MNCASSKAEKRPSKKGRFPFRRNSSKLKVNPEHGTVSNEQKLEDQVGAGLQKSAEGAGSNMNDDAVPHNVLVFEEIGESTDCVDEKDVEELENAAKFSLGQDDGDEDQFVELDGLNKDIKASLNRDDSKTDKTDSDSLEPKKNEVKEDKDITHLDHTDELSLDNDGSKCHQTKYDNLVFPGIEVTSCDGEEERPKVLDEVPTVINKKDQPEEDAESLDDKLAFTKYVDKASVRKALEKHSDDIVEGHDIEVGEELIVQYLNKKDKKHLKMVLRPAAWSMSHEIRKVLWYNMCHYLHKADDGDIYTEYLADLFPNSDNTEELRLPSFVDPTHLYSFHLNLEGIKTVGKILYVVEHACPDIIYSPLLYPIVCLFLHFMDAPQCYGCVYALIRQSDSMFLPTTRTCYEASKLVIRDLAKKYAKGSYSHLVRSVGNIDNVFDSWLWWILEDIPITYLVHIVDCYLHEGIKVGFGVRGLNRREIWKLQMKHEMYVNSVKNVAETPSRANLPLSRSFSGPVILQNIPTTMLTPDMVSPQYIVR